MRIIGQQLFLQNIHVDFDLDESVPPILADKNRLEQVVFNLITNARDAIEQVDAVESGTARRRILFRSYTKSDHAFFSVTDTGAGMDRETRDRIFEPFFTTKEVGQGMGLGLAITYSIVRDFGGFIDVDSREGHGTCITLRFSVAQA